MKKLLPLFLVIALTSCEPTKHIPAIEELYSIDFTPYTKKGFLMTPEKYTGEYESIGMISFVVSPEANYIKGKPKPYYTSSTRPVMISTYFWKTESVPFNIVLDKVYEICTSMGADALMNFEAKTINTEYPFIQNPVVITGYEITGFAIKRKK